MSEEDFLLDLIVGFVRSPTWSTPVNNFIDEHCIVFDSDEENKFIYTDIHKKFTALIEQLLEKQLAAIGITNEQVLFVFLCDRPIFGGMSHFSVLSPSSSF